MLHRIEFNCDKKNANIMTLTIYSKDMRVFNFTFVETESQVEISQYIGIVESFAFSKDYKACFAYSYKLVPSSVETNGWYVLDYIKEYSRMGLDLSDETTVKDFEVILFYC